MQDLEGAISEATERLSKLEKIWPSKESREKFSPKRILCFVDANNHSRDAIRITLHLSNEFDTPFSIRSLFDSELLKLADTDLAHLKQSIIEIVKDKLKETGLNKGVTFLEGDAIESIEKQLSVEYDILVLPVPYHSNLSDHPDAVGLGSLGEYVVTHIDKPLFLVPEIENKSDDLFESVIIVVNDVSDIIQNQNYINAISRNRTHLHFVYLYDAKDIDTLAESSKGIVDSEMVKKRVHTKFEQLGETTVNRFKEHIEQVDYSIFSGDFFDNIQKLIEEKNASLLTIILPENKKGYRYLLFQDILRDKRLELPVMVLRVDKDTDEEIEEDIEDALEEPEAEDSKDETEDISKDETEDHQDRQDQKGDKPIEDEKSQDMDENADNQTRDNSGTDEEEKDE